MSVFLEPRLAITLLGIVATMLSAESVQKGRSPFAERLGEQIAADCVNLRDDPTTSESLGADEYDGEGLAARANPLLVDGVLDRFLYDSTTARRAGNALHRIGGSLHPEPPQPGTTGSRDAGRRHTAGEAAG